MRRLVRRYKKSLPIRQLAFAIIDHVRGHKNFGAQVRAIHSWVQTNIQYVRDVRGVETLATPTKTLEFGKGDCDDQAVLIASLLESIGHPTRFVAIRLQPFGPFVHVFTETKVGRRWYPVETTEKWPAGMGPPKFAGRMIRDN
jgi:transglutaminase-like putative cysteine protease